MVTDHIDSFAPEMSSQGLQSLARNSSEVSSILTGQISSTLHPISVKLDRNNYTIWRPQVLPAARAHRLDQILIGKIPKPPRFSQSTSVNSSQPASNPEYDQWVILDQFLLSWILASISEAMYGHVVNCQTSAEVWSVLEKLFVSNSKARTLQLRFMLQSLKKGALSINDYVLKMRNIADMLSTSGKPVPDEDLILYILGGLGPEFETIVVNITSISEAISLQEAHYLLQSHEIRLEQLSAASVIDVPPAAHITVGGVQNSNTNDGQFRGSSSKNFRPRNVRNPQTSRIVCQLCGKMGHTAMKCFHRFDVYFQSPPRAQNQQFSSLHQPQQPQLQPPPLHQPQYYSTGPLVPSRPIQNSHQQLDSTNTSPHAYIVAPDLNSNTSWFVDSGATHHMTTDSNTLDVSDHYSGTGNVVVGNGQTLDISSVGHTSFPSRKSSKSLHLANDKKSREILLQGNLKEGLYQLDISKVSSNRQFVGFSEDTNVFLPHLATTPSTVNKQSAAPSVGYSLQVNKIESTRCVEDNNTGVGHLWHQRLGHP
ncbi:Retrovirus-related Pol polyprotein from transposon RE1 [Vitis vinifera]|uniref:Retrovirus-related Pol polyprotein from transposon RE1 n=1 Tax=Vitis vinifera TaxID=29760 RepID=A0A438FH07_VITVI|nr:Retrovirus-related Pol polyprotein from transposon RE1 [Vitis vinifera]